ncbi:glutathione S-transferase N-terminal domain-containing protein [Roseixanthobacter glucoisosaccharinicivorans]|uniref:glutathione S-transferase N-terminal domain-containing protein n=1 Tax=Roseixanthobacter glucoisosaccharinicivorans TaxID=3119923 RepID=UPI003726D2AD
MRLRYSPSSPFARKARVAAAHLGLPLELETADTMNADDTVRQQNPLGKIPVLLRENGPALFDSPVILAYFDHVAGGGRILPEDAEARFTALRLEALADGIMDAALLQVYEGRYRSADKRVESWVQIQAGKVTRALAALEADLPSEGEPNVGDITLACALEYLDFRLPGTWREGHPQLVAWLERFSARCPVFADSRPA